MSLLTPRPPFPAVLDSTIIAAFRSCPESMRLAFVEHYKPKELSVHLHAGASYAKGMEVARRAFYEEGQTAEDSIAAGLGACMTAYGSFECPPDSAKSLERTVGALEYYFSQYRLGDDNAIPLDLPGGKKAIEFSFAEPLDVKHPETGDPLIYCGRMDMLCTLDGMHLGEDDKTASQLGASWPRQWDLRSQFTGYCLTGDTEVLTPAGWRRLDLLKRGIEVLQWGAGKLEFTVPSEYHEPEFEGELSRFSGKVSFAATPEHRVPVYDAYTESFKTFTVATLPRNSGAIRFISAGWKEEGESFEEAAVKLMVAIQADGSWVRSSTGKLSSVRFHFSKERKFLRLEEILNQLGMKRTYWNTKDFSLSIETTETLEAIEMLLGPKKLWGSWLLQLSASSLRLLMEELRFWDGAINDTVYATSIKENADWIKTIAALCGMRVSVHTQPYNKGVMYRAVYSETHQHSVHLHQETKVPFKGKVYCLTVPSGYFMIRHEGKISVTGNCWGAQRAAGIKLDGFLVRGVSILKTKYDTLQAITYRPEWQIERWYKQLLRDAQRMIACWQEGYFDLNLDHACAEYGGCQFRQVCLSRDSQPVLDQQFEKRKWNPLTREETKL